MVLAAPRVVRLILGFSALLLVVASSARGEARFGGIYTAWTAGSEPLYATSGDFDEDGHADLITADAGGSTLTLFLSGSLGGPGVGHALDIDQRALLIRSGDWNGDGHLDLALGRIDSAAVAILLGDGRGCLRPSGSLAGESDPRWLEVGDFDGDGRADLVTANFDSSRAAYHRGLDGGQFAPARFVPLSGRVRGLAAGRLDADGSDDLLITLSSDTLATFGVLRGTAGAGPGALEVLESGRGYEAPYYLNLAVADMNGDHTADLVYVDDTRIVVRLGRGDGGYQPALARSAPGYPLFGFALFDATGDGRIDLLATGIDDNRLFLMAGDGQGHLGSSPVLPTAGLPTSVLGADFTGDGRLDLVVCGGSGVLTLYEGSADGGFGGEGFFRLDVAPNRFRVADVNGDAHADILMGTGTYSDDGELRVYRGRGDGTFAPPVVTAAGRSLSDFIVADLDDDGRPDVAAISAYSGHLFVLTGEGDGNFRPAGDWPVDGRPTELAAADFDRDGRTDLALVLIGGNAVQLMHGESDGSFTSRPPLAVGVTPVGPVVGEFTGDRWPDLVVANLESASISLLAGTGDGRLAPARTIRTWSFPISLGAADGNGDCLTDLVVNYRRTSRFSFLAGRGDGTFAERVDERAEDLVLTTSFADLDGDGRLDRLQTRPFPGVITYAPGLPGGGYGIPNAIGTGTYPVEIGVADFDSDGRADLLVRLEEASGFVVLLNRGEPPPGGDGVAEVPRLLGIWPNPSRTGSGIRFAAPPGLPSQLELFDVSGRLVRRVDWPAGPRADERCFQWDGCDAAGRRCASGHYLVRVSAGGAAVTGRLVVTR